MKMTRTDQKRMGFSHAGEIIDSVCEETGISKSQMLGPRKTTTVVAARWHAIRRVREETSLSLLEIGDVFERDHTTILHALRSFE